MPSQVVEQALAFAKGAVSATSAAFYRVDDKFVMYDFVLDGMACEFIGKYVDGMGRYDPLHIRHAGMRPTARLREEIVRVPCTEFAVYEKFCHAFSIYDSLEFFFRRNGKIFAGLNVGWSNPKAIPSEIQPLVLSMHQYLEFNLESLENEADEQTAKSRFILTDREIEVLDLLSCGRTNREIGDCLGLRLPTVKTHIQHIFDKLGVETRSGAVAKHLGGVRHRN
jgi:DNA-binding CsgD family transcriptional regulator